MSNVKELIIKLKSQSGDDAVETASLLASYGDESAIPAILDAINEPENYDYTGPLLQSLIALDCSDYITRLVHVMSHEGYEAKFMAVNVLESIMRPVDPTVKRYVINTINDIEADSSDLPQEELNMFEYARVLIERMDEK